MSVLLLLLVSATADAHFRRGAELAARGELPAAEREYLEGLRISPHPAAYNNLGTLYFQEQDFARAAAAFGSARKLQPADSEIAFNLGLALYKTGKTGDAIPHLVAGEASSHAQEARYLLGACYFAQKQWEKSIAEIEPVANSPEALFILVRAYRYSGKPAQSLDAAARLLKSWPDSAFTHEILGEAYDKDGQPDNAIDEFQKAIAASPKSPELHFMLGYVCWRWKRYDQAIAPLEEETRIHPGYAAAYYYLGDIALRRDDTAQALRYFKEALKLDASYSEASLGIGKVYLRTERVREAVAALRKAKAGLDGATELHYWLGRALIRAGHAEEGRRELARVSQFNDSQHRKMEELFNGVPVGERSLAAAARNQR